MITVLCVLLATAVVALSLGSYKPYARLARPTAPTGIGVALGVALYSEGLLGGGIAGKTVEWPAFLGWVGAPLYRSDALSAGLGAWCLLLGGLCLLALEDGAREPGDQPRAWQPAICTLIIATLYSIVHTWDLMTLAAQLLLLVTLLRLLSTTERTSNHNDSVLTAQRAPKSQVLSPQPSALSPQPSVLSPQPSVLTLGVGAVCLLGAALLVGRTTGGEYNLAELPLSALTRWPMALIAVGAALWLGLAPVTGWSLRGHLGVSAALLQALVAGVPITALLLRLQALVTAQGLAGSVPEDWGAFMAALTWVGGLTALVAGAGAIVAAGTERWQALMSAHTLGLVVWALGLDTPVGRYAALAILASFGAARVVLELSGRSAFGYRRPALLISIMALTAAPLTSGFIGVWLLGTALTQAGYPSTAVAMVGASILAACGAALHFGQTDMTNDGQHRATYAAWASLVGGAALLAGGVAPGLWLPQLASMAGIAGGSIPAGLSLPSTQAGGGLLALLPLLALSALIPAGIGGLVVSWRKSGTSQAGVLLPTALDHGSKVQGPKSKVQSLPLSEAKGPKSKIQGPELALERSEGAKPAGFLAPAPIWWLSLGWLEAGGRRFGALLTGLVARAGNGLGRLEDRYYLPVALILILAALLAITR